MRVIPIKLNTESHSYAETEQSSQIRFNIIRKDTSGEYYQEYKSFKCKDYYNELILGRFLKSTPGSVYRFTQRSLWNDRNLMISVESIRQEEIDNIIRNFEIINSLEEVMSISKKRMSRIYQTNHKNVLIIKFPKEWIRSNVLFSLYTLLIRSFGYVEVKNSSLEELVSKVIYLETSDSYLFEKIFKEPFNIYKLLKNHKEIFSKNPITGLNDRKLKKELLSGNSWPNIGISWDKNKQHDFGILGFVVRLQTNSNDNYLGKDHVTSYLGLE